MITDKKLNARCQRIYMNLYKMRRNRIRLKKFTYGRQWDDPVAFSNSGQMTEGQAMWQQGRAPVTNNLIRQMVKTVVGRFRSLRPDTRECEARALEEFLISGMAAVRVRPEGETCGPEMANISPDRIFFSPFLESDASDCRLLGMLHDFSPAEVLRRFAVNRAPETVWDAFTRAEPVEPYAFTPPPRWEYGQDAPDGLFRVAEVWRRSPVTLLKVFDPESGCMVEGECTRGARARLRKLGRSRAEQGREQLKFNIRVDDGWEHTWLGPGGVVLLRERLPETDTPALRLCFYPMIDGEVHSLVEDVISQQKLVNRLVTMLDEMLAASAKGVVLYPTDQIPDGMSWSDLRRMWSTPGSILPFKRTSKSVMPHEVQGAPATAGATQLLDTQLNLFQEVSGMPAPLRSGGRTVSAEALEADSQRASLAMLDLLSTFEHFITSCRSLGSELPQSAATREIVVNPVRPKGVPGEQTTREKSCGAAMSCTPHQSHQ